jgi:Rod binding domain-containing protein
MDAQPLAMFDARTAPVTRAQPPAGAVAKGASKAEISDAAEKFEGMFLSQMFQYMFEGVDADPMFGGGSAEKMYRSLMIDEYGKQVAAKGGLGIADHVYDTLLAAQEKRA